MNPLPVSLNGVTATPLAPVLADPQVRPRRRRSFSAAYKLRIVNEAELCTQPGQIGALLRREDLHSSLLTSWRQPFRRGGAPALEP